MSLSSQSLGLIEMRVVSLFVEKCHWSENVTHAVQQNLLFTRQATRKNTHALNLLIFRQTGTAPVRIEEPFTVLILIDDGLMNLGVDI